MPNRLYLGRKFKVLLLVVLAAGQLFATEKQDFSVSAIAPDLLKDAATVIRYRTEQLTFKAEGVEQEVSYAITIINKNSISASYFIEGYDKYSKILSVTGKIYDAYGKKIKSLSASDIIDASNISDGAIFDESRIKGYSPDYYTVPFTVEYSYKKVFKKNYIFPTWSAYRAWNQSVVQSDFIVLAEHESPVQINETLGKGNFTKTLKYEGTMYEWHETNLPAIRAESDTKPFANLVPTVWVTPQNIAFEDYAGSANSWQSLGQWGYNLLTGKDALPAEVVQQIHQLTDTISTEYDKIKACYSFMQNRSRYVSIQLGIGGLQPFSAQWVHENRYGDCKALTNYMMALLKVIGIKSYSAWVAAGADAPEVQPSFPNDRFNHVILCVPFSADTLWLECTSMTSPFGYTGIFTDDRPVLLLTETGGKLVRTKTYNCNENIKTTVAEVTITPDGKDVNASVNIAGKGLFYEQSEPLLVHDPVKKKRAVLDNLNIPSIELGHFEITEQRDRCPAIVQNLIFTQRNYLQPLGSRFMLPLGFGSTEKTTISTFTKRKFDVYIRRNEAEKDSIVFIVPVDYVVENTPAKEEIKTKYGEYHIETKVEGNRIIFCRYFSLNKGCYPVEEYNDFIGFKNLCISKDKNAKCTLRKL